MVVSRQRSYRGQDLHGAINESEENLKIITPQLEEIRKIPQKNWKRVRRHFIHRIAMPLAVCIGLIVGPLRTETKTNQARENTEMVTSNSVPTEMSSKSKKDGSDQKKESSSIYFLSSVGKVSVVAWIICWGIMAVAYSQKYPKPNIVTIHNVSAN